MIVHENGGAPRVGIMIGGAMAQIAGSLVSDVLMPLILWVDPEGGSLTNRYLLLHPGKNHTDDQGGCSAVARLALVLFSRSPAYFL
jgi:hypothetical protein